LIVAISAVSESGDHYLWCETGIILEIIAKIATCEDFAYLRDVQVVPLQSSEWDTAGQLRERLVKAIDKAYEDQ
jgi:hypothetical protein